ncbi:MAG TPA: hypothetical protein VHE30_18590 [Polyangiaceae bacterium]|nr:hypothetical protein [Polyangiaceae bacterium]
MPRCYFLTVCSGSAVDQHSNNVTLFNLVEQINVPPGAPPPPHGIVPLEVHAYFDLDAEEVGRDFEIRFVLVAATGLETPTDAFGHRSVTPRYRTRTFGLPFPPVAGQYQLRVDVRLRGEETFRRGTLAWPIAIVEATAAPPGGAVH